MQMIEHNKLPTEITSHIIKFKDFLCNSWTSIDKLMEFHNWEDDGNFLDDWIDYNWKFLIGRELLGNGEDLLPLYNTQYDPVSKNYQKVIAKIHDSFPLIDLIKKTENYKGESLLISGFLTPCGPSFGLYPPFDHVKLRSIAGNKLYVVPISKCFFFLTSHTEKS